MLASFLGVFFLLENVKSSVGLNTKLYPCDIYLSTRKHVYSFLFHNIHKVKKTKQKEPGTGGSRL
jgi:hypothetical protein